MAPHYSNVTLTSLGGDLSVVVYLPLGIEPGKDAYYYSSRFDHGSMIGSISRRRRYIGRDGQEKERTHLLYGTDIWRQPHNAYWPESGVGLAAEFGVGDDGAFCYYRCGWPLANDVTNGVLGHNEARNGESFLKIGVGELIKGSCPACDSTDDYRFNSPYLFARPPEWKLNAARKDAVQLEHSAVLKRHGYRILRDIVLLDNVLSVTTALTNLGSEHFSTAWYSHHFFTCDGEAVGPGYSVDLNLKGDRNPIYEEPGTWSWATPLEDYAKIHKHPNTVSLDMVRALFPGIRLKAEFTNDDNTNGGFTLHACHTSIETSIPEVEQDGGKITMYAYNLYVERGTFSPEPQIFINNLGPGESTAWTQRLVITDSSVDTEELISSTFWNLQTIGSFLPAQSPTVAQNIFAVTAIISFVGLLFLALQTRYHRRDYDHIV
jgi:hypothetical protein